MGAHSNLCDREGYKKRKAAPAIVLKKEAEPEKEKPKKAPAKKGKSLKGDK